jgi:hypothetical protein
MAYALAYTDTVFRDDDWDTYREGDGSTGVFQFEGGGNPAPSRWVSNTVLPDSTVYAFHMRRSAAWDPSASAGVVSVAFSIDGMPLDDAAGDGMGFTFAIRQGGRNFEVVTSAGVGSVAGVWKTLSYTGLTAGDFRTVTGALATPDFSATGGLITFGFRTGNTAVGEGYGRAALFDNWSVVVTPVVPIVPAVPSGTDRYRMSLSADSRSLLAAVQAVPFDASATVNLPAGANLPQQTLYPVRELTRSVTDPIVDAAFFPRAAQNQNHERQYDGVTLLSRMRTAYPAKIVDTVDRLGLADNSARSIITHVLTRWATEFAWFEFETVPDLRMPMPGTTGVMQPSEYDTVPVTRLGVVRSDAVVFPQDDDERLSAFDMLDALLSPFPGAVFFANSAGKLQIVPAYGPDADAAGAPFKTLTTDDVVSVSLGEPNAADIINKATVTSRGYQEAEDVPLMQPAWAQFGPSQAFGLPDRWYEPPNDRVNMQPTTTGDVLQETLTPADSFNRQGYLAWPISTTAVPAGSGISLVDGSSVPQVTVGWTMYRTSSVLSTSTGSSGLTLLETSVPFDGVTRDTLRLDLVADGIPFNLLISARWDSAQSAIALTARTAAMFFVSTDAEYVLIAEFAFDDSSRGAVVVSGPNVTYDASSNSIPGAGGTNAIQESVDAYGELEERIDVRGYTLTGDQAFSMARGIVIANLSPRAIRELDLSARGSTIARFDDRGRLFGLPDGGEGLLVGVQYQDDFVSRSWSKRVRVEETIAGAAGFIPPDGEWLLNDDESFWQNEDESFSEPA